MCIALISLGTCFAQVNCTEKETVARSVTTLLQVSQICTTVAQCNLCASVLGACTGDAVISLGPTFCVKDATRCPPLALFINVMAFLID